MADILLRSVKGSPLTIEELDTNFVNLNVEVGEKLDRADYNAADVLLKLLTVDGEGSGLSADTLQGLYYNTALPAGTDKSSIVARNASGNFTANIITASLVGNVTGNVTGNLTGNASTASKFQAATLINGVSYDGSDDITVFDATKLPLAGGTLTGYLTLHANPVNALHAATKGYVDTYGVPQGAIIMWSGTTLPTGWGLCDGTIQNGIQTPDLRDRFIYGAATLAQVKTTGGSTTASTSSAGEHDHDGSTLSHVLTVQQIPAHSHSLASPLIEQSGGGIARHQAFQSNTGTLNTTGSTGGNLGHSHGINTDGAHTHTVTGVMPPYIKLAFIMKLI